MNKNIIILSIILFLVVIGIILYFVYFNNPSKSKYKKQFDWNSTNFNNFIGINPNQWSFSTTDNDIDNLAILDPTNYPYKDMDLTHGWVVYGKQPKLISVDDNNKLRINMGKGSEIVNLNNGDQKNNIELYRRPAPRIHCNTTFTSGLFILDIEHIPTGPGVWPSIWLNGNITGKDYASGQKWACKGELDIIEGITDIKGKSTHNLTTIHTNQENVIDKDTGIYCNASENPNLKTCGCDGKQSCPTKGCSYVYDNENTFGVGFKGGIFACNLVPTTTDQKIATVWFWPKNDPNIPDFDNIDNVDNWKAQNKKVFPNCVFGDLALIINTTLCGDWAALRDSNGSPYDPYVSQWSSKNVCNSIAGDTKNDYGDAYWLINSIKVLTNI